MGTFKTTTDFASYHLRWTLAKKIEEYMNIILDLRDEELNVK